MSNLIEQRDVVVATVEKLKAKLGEAITSGNEKARIKASADLAEAQRVVAELNTAIEAVQASEAAAARRAEEAARDKADQERKASIDAAHADLASLVNRARGVDTALAALDKAIEHLGREGDSYLAKHAALGIHQNARDRIRTRGWLNEVWAHLQHRSTKDLRTYFMGKGAGLRFAGTSQFTVEESMPDITRILTGTPRKVAAQAEPAVGSIEAWHA